MAREFEVSFRGTSANETAELKFALRMLRSNARARGLVVDVSTLKRSKSDGTITYRADAQTQPDLFSDLEETR